MHLYILWGSLAKQHIMYERVRTVLIRYLFCINFVKSAKEVLLHKI